MVRAATLVASLTLALAAAALLTGACTTKEPQATTYFDTTIAPILQTSCVRTNTGVGCHVADAKGNAFGNLDLSSYAGVDKRRDLLLDYGPYLQPSLLVKNVTPYQMAVQLWDGTKVTVTTDVKHTGGPVLDPTASAYLTLRRWIENGATTNNSGVPPVNLQDDAVLPHGAGGDRLRSVGGAEHAGLRDVPVGRGPRPPGVQRRQLPRVSGERALPHVRTDPRRDALELLRGGVVPRARRPRQAELLRRPLATSQGGSYHEGGPLFSSVMDSRYLALQQWAKEYGPAEAPDARSGLRLLRAEGAAPPREEGLHDGAVPLGRDVPRVPPSRRVGGQLFVHDHGAQLHLHRGADVVRERRREREPARAKEPLPSRELQRAGTASV